MSWREALPVILILRRPSLGESATKQAVFTIGPLSKSEAILKAGSIGVRQQANTHPATGASAARRRLALHAPDRALPQLWKRDHAPFCAQRKLARVTAWSKDHSSDAGRAHSKR